MTLVHSTEQSARSNCDCPKHCPVSPTTASHSRRLWLRLPCS